MTITVRAAGEAGLPFLLALYAELHPADPPLAPDAALPIWRQIRAQRGRAVLLAERGGQPAGTADCTILPNLTRGGRPLTPGTPMPGPADSGADIHTELTHNPRGALTCAADDGAQPESSAKTIRNDVNHQTSGSRTTDSEGC